MPSIAERYNINLEGLTAEDRTKEEKQSINEQMGYENSNSLISPDIDLNKESYDTVSSATLNNIFSISNEQDEIFNESLSRNRNKYGVDLNLINSNAETKFDEIANIVSSNYKKYKNTDYLPLDNQKKKELLAEYDTRKELYGEENADIWLDGQMQDIVGHNQPWWDQAISSISHVIPTVEGGAIQAMGMAYGAINHVIGTEGYEGNPDLGTWDSFWDAVIDNPVTRYGKDVEHAGASHILQGLENAALSLFDIEGESVAERIARTKATATKYNPQGLGTDNIVATQEQQEALLSAVTPWEALQSGGFTLLSMLFGAGEAKVANWMFKGLFKGANGLYKANKIIKTEKALQNTLEGLKKAQNVVDLAIIPGSVGTVEGITNALETKINVQNDAQRRLDDYYKRKIANEARDIYDDNKTNPFVIKERLSPSGEVIGEDLVKERSYEEIEAEVAAKYAKEYQDALRHIDWASSKASIHNFYANAAINGMINATFKAGLMAPRVEETLRNSKLFGWAYNDIKFTTNSAGEIVPKMGAYDIAKRVIKEPLGEAFEEYMQSVSDITFSGAAEHNIDEYIKNRFDGDGADIVATNLGSDIAAAWTAFKGSVVDKESIKSAILGAISSSMGTFGGVRRGYHINKEGKLEKNGWFDKTNFTGGYTENGVKETWFDVAKRFTPWRSGVLNAYFDAEREYAEAKEVAATLNEWLKDPVNKAKWDGLQGSANWMKEMVAAAQSNDQFSYRNSQMGKAINDIFMLSKLKGTAFYDTAIADLQKAASGNFTNNDISKVRENGGEDYEGKSDSEIAEKLQKNAIDILNLISKVESESKNVTSLFGRINDDARQSIVFMKMMTNDFQSRKDALKRELEEVEAKINSTASRNNVRLTPEQMEVFVKNGSFSQAKKNLATLREQRAKLREEIDNLERIDKKLLSEEQKKSIDEKKQKLKEVNVEIKTFNPLFKKGENGKTIEELDENFDNIVLNEADILALDPVTRGKMLRNGAARFYNATHLDRHLADKMNLEIAELERQIENLKNIKAKMLKNDQKTNRRGKDKKHREMHEKKVDKQIEEAQGKRDALQRQLDVMTGKVYEGQIYSDAQQEVIDSLLQQGYAMDTNFLDKVVDIGRLESIQKSYNKMYLEVISDPSAYNNYINRYKQTAAEMLLVRRAERVGRLEDFQDYSREVDALLANISEREKTIIIQTLKSEDDKIEKTQGVKSNFERFVENNKLRGELIKQFAYIPNLTDNDMSLLSLAIQYLQSKGVDLSSQGDAVEALLEPDVLGVQGGKFREFVERLNDGVPEAQKTFMPTFTSIGQIVSQWVDLINSYTMTKVGQANLHPEGYVQIIGMSPEGQVIDPVKPVETGNPAPEERPAPTAEVAGPNGHINTDAQLKDVKQTMNKGTETASPMVQLFSKVLPVEEAEKLSDVETIINNANVSDEAKQVALDTILDIAAGTEKFSSIEEFVGSFPIADLRNQYDANDKETYKYGEAATTLERLAIALKKGKTATVDSNINEDDGSYISTRYGADNPKSAIIHANRIGYILKNYPNSWAATFFNHNILPWLETHNLEGNETVYFIVNSEWSAETASQMDGTDGRPLYETRNNMPLVAAIRIDDVDSVNKSTAININGIWYQPIGIMPSSNASKVQGSAHTQRMRDLASKDVGAHLVTTNGTTPLVSKLIKGHSVLAHNASEKRKNSRENNSSMIAGILEMIPDVNKRQELVNKLNSGDRKSVFSDPDYQNAKSIVLSRLSWGKINSNDSEEKEGLLYTPNAMHGEEKARPIKVFTVAMKDSVSRNSNETLPQVLESITDDSDQSMLDRLVTFNSRTQRLFNNVIVPLFDGSVRGSKGGKNVKIITQQDLENNPDIYNTEIERIEKELLSVSDFIYINPKAGWKIKVFCPSKEQVVGDLNTSKTVYRVIFSNESENKTIVLGDISAGAGVTKEQTLLEERRLLRNIIWDNEEQAIRPFLLWQIPAKSIEEIQNAASDPQKAAHAKNNYSDIIDDGIIEFSGGSKDLTYEVDALQIRSPFDKDNNPLYKEPVVASADNAQASSPIGGAPAAPGTIITPRGQTVDPNSGARFSQPSTTHTTQQQSPIAASANEEIKRKEAEEKTRKIVADSKNFILSSDEKYYYVEDKANGTITKYLRVTSVISADRSIPDMTDEERNKSENWYKESRWTPSLYDIYQRLKGAHPSINTATKESLRSIHTIEEFSNALGIDQNEIRNVIAQMRSEHDKEKYGAWGIPSEAMGNTMDSIVRDFFAGTVKTEYPNITSNALNLFLQQLTAFKNSLDAAEIHIEPNGVIAHGQVVMTDHDGTTHTVNVAGTLDLFGYDSKGNFYIFDMKTTHNHSSSKINWEKAKWSRQLTMYAALLEQTYGVKVDTNNLIIIPINVDYDKPFGDGEGGTSRVGPVYSVDSNGQLKQSYRGHGVDKDFKMDVPKTPTEANGDNAMGLRRTTLDRQEKVGRSTIDIDFDNLSSDDQAIANALVEELKANGGADASPATATVPIQQPVAPAIADTGKLGKDDSTQDPLPLAPPVVQFGAAPQDKFKTWNELKNSVKEALLNECGIESEEDYNAMLNDTDGQVQLKNFFTCH